jgi:hypothetical protein
MSLYRRGLRLFLKKAGGERASFPQFSGVKKGGPKTALKFSLIGLIVTAQPQNPRS